MQVTVKVNLGQTLDDAGITRNAVAVEGKIRPATISELCNGKSKAISFETMERIVNAMTTLTGDKYVVSDILTIEYDD